MKFIVNFVFLHVDMGIEALFTSLWPQYPTLALAPLMLEDYRKVMVDRRGEAEQFSNDHIMECMKKGN